MKKSGRSQVLFCVACFLFGLMLACNAENRAPKADDNKITHIVLFKFKEGSLKEDIDDAFDTLLELKGKIPGIISITAGTFESQENLNKEFSYGFVIEFADHTASETYHSHPERQILKKKFINLLDGGLDGVIAGELIPGDYDGGLKETSK